MNTLLASFCAGLIGMAVVAVNADEYETAGGNAAAEEYLELYKEFSGRCMNLRRGDMRMVRNTHPDKIIEYRMVRTLAGKPQASIIRSRIEPGEEGQALGCEKLDGLEQVWVVIRAHFVDNP